MLHGGSREAEANEETMRPRLSMAFPKKETNPKKGREENEGKRKTKEEGKEGNVEGLPCSTT